MVKGCPSLPQTAPTAPHLGLFFTRRTSLQTWQQIGMLDRELALYRALAKRGVTVSLYTYGGPADLRIAADYPELQVYCNRWRLNRRLYEYALPHLHRRSLRQVDVLKTNQTNGGLVAMAAARRWQKPLVARCGYMWSEFEIRQHGETSRQAREALDVENRLFPFASRGVVTTPAMQTELQRRFPDRANRFQLIPNYVDCERFASDELPDQLPAGSRTREYDLVFVGRLDAEQKNVPALLDAIAPLGIRALLIGRGEQAKTYWQQHHSAATSTITWLSHVPHDQLPSQLHRGRLFVLPSLYEGHPKALIEAMACGCAIVATDVPGIREVLRHRQNAWLTTTDVAGLRAGIQAALADDEKLPQLGHAARQDALHRYSLASVVEKELSLIKELSSGEENTRLQAA